MAKKSKKMSQKEKDANEFARKSAEQKQVMLGNNPDGTPKEAEEEVNEGPIDTSPFKAQFGRTKNLLRYDQIAAAHRDRNVDGQVVGGIANAIGDAISSTDQGPEDEAVEEDELPKYEKQFDPDSVEYIEDNDDEADLDAILAGNEEVIDDDEDIPIVPEKTALQELIVDLNTPAVVNEDFFKFDPTQFIARSDTVGSVQTHTDPSRPQPTFGGDQSVLTEQEQIAADAAAKSNSIFQRRKDGPFKRMVSDWMSKNPDTPLYRQNGEISKSPLYRMPDGGVGPHKESRVHDEPTRRGRNPYKPNFTVEEMYGKTPLPRIPEGNLERAAVNRKMRREQEKSTGTKNPLKRFLAIPKNGSARRTPFMRLSLETPFHAEDLPGIGMLDKSQPLSYLGDIGAAASEGYNKEVDKHNYKQAVWNEQQKETDEFFGDLVYDPTGVSTFDASQEKMLRGKKTEFADLMRQHQKGTISAADFSTKTAAIRQTITDQEGMAKNLTALTEQYAADKDNISLSTKPETIDALNALYNGADGFEMMDVEGIPTMVGKTPGGKDVFIPASSLASGKNAFRYNKKVDTTDHINKIATDLGKLERDLVLASGGVRRGGLPWDKLKGSALKQINGLLENEADVRAIAADKLGVDYDEYQNRKDNGEDMKAFVADEMLEDVREINQPYSNQFQLKANPIISQQIKVDTNRRSNQRRIEGNASERGYKETQAFVNDNIVNAPQPLSYEYLETLEGTGINEVQENETTGLLRVYYGKGKKFIDIDPNNQGESKRKLAGALGLKPGEVADLNKQQ